MYYYENNAQRKAATIKAQYAPDYANLQLLIYHLAAAIASGMTEAAAVTYVRETIGEQFDGNRLLDLIKRDKALAYEIAELICAEVAA